MEARIRPAEAGDASFLAEMLVEAANWDPARSRRRIEVLADPKVTRYISGWPRPADGGVVAVDPGGGPVGACWFRVLPEQAGGYGFIAPGVPELTLGVRAVHRAQGTGRALLRAACALAAERGHLRVSLSVERANFAHRLYVAEGFATVASGPDADTMAKTLR